MKPACCLALSCLIALALAAPAGAAARSADTFASVLAARMPELLAHYQVPGAVVSYIDDGAVAWTQAFGVSNLAAGAPMTAEMVFNHGSDSKVLTAWGVLRLAELGAVDLDAPINRYLKRWQLPASDFSPEGVTLRRLLSHTGGITVRGFSDYGPRRTLPNLVQVLEGQNQLDGSVVIGWEPGTRFEYSGGGYALLQMVIEDVSGEPFAVFMQREITSRLGMSSLRWAWMPELAAQAPTPYGLEQEPLEYRQLASQAVGSAVSTVPDFARFVAAAVAGPAAEPAGRGALQPATVAQMTTVQPNTNGTEGLGYGVGSGGGDRLLMHFGSNPGWNAHFVLAIQRREGFVIANNSAHGGSLNLAVHFLWLSTVLGEPRQPLPSPAASSRSIVATTALGLSALLGGGLLLALGLLAFQIGRGRRTWAPPRSARRWLPAALWGLLALGWWYWFYAHWPLPFEPRFPDIWWLPPIGYVMALLLGWAALSVVAAFLPRTTPQTQETRRPAAAEAARR